MRGLRSTIALVVVLGALVGYIYFVDRERPLTETEPKAKAFDVSPENIEEVAVTNAAGETARVQRIDTSWQLVEPERADADATQVASMTSSLASLEVQRVVEENPGDLAQYGLDRPRIDVAFRVRGQKEFQRLLIGEKAPAGGDIYAKTPDQSRVFLISSFLDTTFAKTPFDLRDKTVLKFERDRADALEVVSGSGSLQFSKQGSEWRLARPIAARADFAAVEGLMTRLDEARMQRIVAGESTDLRPYGLNAPSLRVNVSSGSAQATLLIGGADPDGLPFAKDAARPSIFTIEQSLATDLRRAADEYRRKDVFDARSFTITRIELRRDGATQAFEKTKGADGADAWKDAAGKDADRTKVEDLLGRLTGLRAASFEPARHASLGTPALTAVVRFDDKTETVTFGRAGSDAYSARTDEPGSARLEAGAFDEVLTALDGLK
jgi:hypothetical protein